jgi:hypothetical protein
MVPLGNSSSLTKFAKSSPVPAAPSPSVGRRARVGPIHPGT